MISFHYSYIFIKAYLFWRKENVDSVPIYEGMFSAYSVAWCSGLKSSHRWM